MSQDLTPEQALEKLGNMSSFDLLNALSQDIDKSIVSTKDQISVLQGQVRGFQMVKRMLEAIKNTHGSRGPEPSPASLSSEAAPNPVADAFDKEKAERIAKNQCTFKTCKAEGGKWCQRKLKTKEEKSKGYCSVHLTKLGLDDK